MGYAYLYFLRRVPCLSPLPPLPSALSRPLSVPNVLHKYVFPTESPILTPFVMLAVVPARAWMQQLLACYFVYEECADSNRHLTGLRVQGYNPNRNATAALQLPIGLKRPCRRAGSNRKRYYIRHPTTFALVYAKCADSYTHLTQPQCDGGATTADRPKETMPSGRVKSQEVLYTPPHHSCFGVRKVCR